MKFENIGVVIVLYYPDVPLLLSNVQRLTGYVGSIYLVDNTPGNDNRELSGKMASLPGLYYIPLFANLGIAEGQNRGVQKVFEDKSKEFVLLLDQDSEIDGTVVEELISGYSLLKSNGIDKIATIGPSPVNKDSNKVYKDRDLSKKYVSQSIVRKSEIMSSGSLIPRQAWEDIGTMESALFIDGVDSEWCWRGARKGYTSFINEAAVLRHKLGVGDTKFLGLRFATPPPIRCFYQYRNYLILARRSYVPMSWKILNLVKYLVKFAYYPLFLKDGKAYFLQMTNGIRAGLRYK